MKQLLAVVLLVSFFAGIAGAQSLAPYDKNVVVKAMRDNMSLTAKARTAIGSGNFDVAAQAFFDLALIGVELKKMTPPKGSAADWAKAWEEFAAAGYKGVGASGEKDAAKARVQLDAIMASQKSGHGTFK